MKHKQREILLQKESKIRFRRGGFSIRFFAIDKLASFPIIPREIREQDTESNSWIVYLEIVEIKATIFFCLIMVPDEFCVAIPRRFSPSGRNELPWRTFGICFRDAFRNFFNSCKCKLKVVLFRDNWFQSRGYIRCFAIYNQNAHNFILLESISGFKFLYQNNIFLSTFHRFYI